MKNLTLQSNQTLGVILTLVTISDPEMTVHQNDLAYRSDGTVKIGHACVFVPIDVNECTAEEKKYKKNFNLEFPNLFPFLFSDYNVSQLSIKNVMNTHLKLFLSTRQKCLALHEIVSIHL